VFSCGSWSCEPTLCKQPSHTILAYGQWERIWSTLSFACRQVAQGSGWSCKPCRALLSEVQSLYLSANQPKILHLRGAKVVTWFRFKGISSVNTCNASVSFSEESQVFSSDNSLWLWN
jgi:hypothetical protein